MPKFSALQSNALVVLFLATLATLALSFWIYAIWDFGQGAQTFQGRVVGYKCRLISCTVQVRVNDDAADVHLIVSGRRLAQKPYQEGATVPVLYNSLKHEAVIDTYQQRWSQPVFYFGLSMLFLFLCAMGTIQLFQRGEYTPSTSFINSEKRNATVFALVAASVVASIYGYSIAVALHEITSGDSRTVSGSFLFVFSALLFGAILTLSTFRFFRK